MKEAGCWCLFHLLNEHKEHKNTLVLIHHWTNLPLKPLLEQFDVYSLPDCMSWTVEKKQSTQKKKHRDKETCKLYTEKAKLTPPVD